MKLAIGADHRGFKQKELLIAQLKQNNEISCVDVGTNSVERTDYPCYAQAVVASMQQDGAYAGILLCGSGAGMAIAANRYKHIYAAVAWNEQVARVIKEDDNINVLVIPSDFVSDKQIVAIVASWLDATFKGGRYEQRLRLIDEK